MVLASVLNRIRGEPDPRADPHTLADIGDRVRQRLATCPQAENLGGRKADLFRVRAFLSPEECAQLIALIDSKIAPSTLFREPSTDDARTSSTHYFERGHPQVGELERRIDGLLGLDRRHAETTQGQRYHQGEQYKHHCDFFHTDRSHWQSERRRGGQRSWTAMVYLNTVEAGGETEFPRLGLSFRPEAGMLLTWNNMDRKGRPNRATKHAGLPVEAGSKYIVTQWYRMEEWSLRLR